MPSPGALRLLPMLLLAACSSAPSGRAAGWSHPVKDSSEWKVDMAQCERFFGGSEADRNNCMRSKGGRFGK